MLELSQFTKIRSLNKNDVIFRQGQTPKDFTFVNKGLVKITRSLKNAKELILRFAGEGDIFGATAVFSGEIYAVSAVCEGDVTFVEIPKNRFLKFMEKNPSIYRDVLASMSEKNHQYVLKVPEMALLKIESRIAKVLLDFTEEIGYKKGDHYHLYLPLTKQEIAALVGNRVETVVRTFKSLKTNKVIAVDKHNYTILDKPYLESLVADWDQK
jgi:CRP-like cAMP-binding protein